mmetsp:Transcript_3916/g.12235  ORF Transcript_3916/g.12235 Transcript_3916/m.12235 type:complete len:300 (-) Transcript_3916:750-1649(-)
MKSRCVDLNCVCVVKATTFLKRFARSSNFRLEGWGVLPEPSCHGVEERLGAFHGPLLKQLPAHDFVERLVGRGTFGRDVLPAPLDEGRIPWWAVLWNGGTVSFSNELLYAKTGRFLLFGKGHFSRPHFPANDTSSVHVDFRRVFSRTAFFRCNGFRGAIQLRASVVGGKHTGVQAGILRREGSRMPIVDDLDKTSSDRLDLIKRAQKHYILRLDVPVDHRRLVHVSQSREEFTEQSGEYWRREPRMGLDCAVVRHTIQQASKISTFTQFVHHVVLHGVWVRCVPDQPVEVEKAGALKRA